MEQRPPVAAFRQCGCNIIAQAAISFSAPDFAIDWYHDVGENPANSNIQGGAV
jgi:hypothetical protein